MKRVTFYYVRHGRTEFNRDGIVQGGGVDSPLVEDSIPLIEATARALAQVLFASCYCSPLGRARETARMVVGERDLAIQPLDLLHEFNFGALDGQPFSKVGPQFVSCFIKQNFKRYGGESGAEVRARVRAAFEYMFNRASDGDNVLVVAHGALFRYVLLEFYPASALRRKLMSETVHTPNAGIAIVKGTAAVDTATERGGAPASPVSTSAGGYEPRQSASLQTGARGTSWDGRKPHFVLTSLPVSGDEFAAREAR